MLLASLVSPQAAYGEEADAPLSSRGVAPAHRGGQRLSVASTVGMGLVGLAVGTGVVAGVSALVGHLMYPEVGAAKFAKVGAVSYAAPAILLLGLSAAAGVAASKVPKA